MISSVSNEIVIPSGCEQKFPIVLTVGKALKKINRRKKYFSLEFDENMKPVEPRGLSTNNIP